MPMAEPMPRGWKKHATERCRAIVAMTAPGQPVTGDDAEWLTWLVTTRHPCASEKIGAGISWFTTQVVMPFRTLGLVIRRVDGTATDVSWRECITPRDHSSLVRGAMRRAIESQVTAFKAASDEDGGLYDAITGEALTWDNVHVDHAPPVFVIISDAYAALFGGYEAIPLTPSEDGQIGRALTGKHEELWPVFHRAFARLRIVSEQTNMSLLRRQQSSA
jgi:Protein of unknown function (DUF3223)